MPGFIDEYNQHLREFGKERMDRLQYAVIRFSWIRMQRHGPIPMPVIDEEPVDVEPEDEAQEVSEPVEHQEHPIFLDMELEEEPVDVEPEDGAQEDLEPVEHQEHPIFLDMELEAAIDNLIAGLEILDEDLPVFELAANNEELSWDSDGDAGSQQWDPEEDEESLHWDTEDDEDSEYLEDSEESEESEDDDNGIWVL